jgi:hypothetical protein
LAESSPTENPAGARRRPLPWLLLAAVVAGGGFLFLRLTAPVLVFHNRLVEPVRLVVNERAERLVAPGGTVEVRVERGKTLVAGWALQQPAGPDGRPLGEPIQGSFVLRGPSGRLERAAEARQGGSDYFAPLVSNASGVPLRIRVNAGLAGARDCVCNVVPGAQRARIGYYRLYANSTVEARDASGRRATFRDVGPQVRAASGALGLRFGPADLR